MNNFIQILIELKQSNFSTLPANQYFSLSRVEKIIFFTSFKEMKDTFLAHNDRGFEVETILKSLKSGNEETNEHGVPLRCFPLIVLKSFYDEHFLVYPTENERSKIIGESATKNVNHLLEEILAELRYNPDAGSRVSEARARFIEKLEKVEDK